MSAKAGPRVRRADFRGENSGFCSLRRRRCQETVRLVPRNLEQLSRLAGDEGPVED
jgi:hypothetical protein